MLSRYHLMNATLLVGLGLIGSYLFPMATVPIPWTVIALVLLGSTVSAAISFAGAARFSSMMLSAENMRFSRYNGPKSQYRFVNDGEMTWAVIPVKGWNYLKTKINSAGNPGIAIFPARLMEQESAYYPVARTVFYKLSTHAISVLSKKRSFGRLFRDLNYVPDGKTEVFLGLGSRSLHPDVVHLGGEGVYDLDAYAESLANTEIDLKRVSSEIRQWTKGQLSFWKDIKGSNAAPVVVRREQRDEEEGERR